MLATSPDRFGFMIEMTKKQLESDPDNETLKKLIEFYKECRIRDGIADEIKGMEYELRSSEKIVKKCKESIQYSQNLYAALCNNNFIKNDEKWSCSWRHSGGIIANLREEGDYIDWYCSGMGDGGDYEDENGVFSQVKKGNVSEGFVTEEIRKDIGELGWEVEKV